VEQIGGFVGFLNPKLLQQEGPLKIAVLYFLLNKPGSIIARN